MFIRKKLLALLLAVLMLLSASCSAEEEDDHWTEFLLICNEGMQNASGDVGNTLMVISMNDETGEIRQVMWTWDTFIDYPGYDLPQLLDQPFRVGGAKESLRVFNEIFGTDIRSYLSINFLNLSSLIDQYGGVTISLSREERNALNGMVGSKQKALNDILSSMAVDSSQWSSLLSDYYLDEYGPGVHLSGLQAVGFGWLQYDSVSACCEREVAVIAQLFAQLGVTAKERIVFYDDETGKPEATNDGRPQINLDDLSESDLGLIYNMVRPVFEESENNLSAEMIDNLSLAMVRAVYESEKNGPNSLELINHIVLPLEHTMEYTTIAGIKGHVIDVAENAAAMKSFLRTGEGTE